MSKKYTCTGMNCGGRVKGYADGGAVERAKGELGRRMRDRDASKQGMTIMERDRVEATEAASASGDYAPNGRGGKDYRPWNPRGGQ